MSLELVEWDASWPMVLPYFEGKVPAGFPSPAEDYLETPLDLTEYLIENKAATNRLSAATRAVRPNVLRGRRSLRCRFHGRDHGMQRIAHPAGEVTIKGIELELKTRTFSRRIRSRISAARDGPAIGFVERSRPRTKGAGLEDRGPPQRHAGAGKRPRPERRAERRGLEAASGVPVAAVDYAVGRTAGRPCEISSSLPQNGLIERAPVKVSG